VKKLNYKWLLVFFLWLISLGLRVYRLDNFPAAFHRDEVAIAYNAYSLVQTGFDEHGAGPYPLNFQSFGDYKLPGLIYFTALFFKIFGQSLFSFRLGMALLASLLPLIIALLIWRLSSKFSWGLASGFWLAFSPWHLFGSRTLYEPLAGQVIFWLGMAFLFWGLKKQRFLIPSIFFILLSTFFYNVPFLLAVPYFLILIFIYRFTWIKKRKTKIIFLFTFLCLVAGLILVSRMINKNLDSRWQTTIFRIYKDDKKINREIHLLTTAGLPLPLSRLFANKPYYLLKKFLEEYLKIWSFDFLFVQGDPNPWRDMGAVGIGLLLLCGLPLLVLGITSLWRFKDKRLTYFLFFLLFISPVPSALTIDSPSTNRLQDFLLLLTILTGIGLATGINWVYKSQRWWVKYGFGFVSLTILLYSFTSLFFAFFVLYPKQMEVQWYQRADQLVKEVKKVEDQYQKILVNTDNAEFIYIYFAFFSPFEPLAFQKEAGWVKLGLSRVVSFNKYIFDKPPDFRKRDEANKFFTPGVERILLVDRGEYQGRKVVVKIYDWEKNMTWYARELSKEDVFGTLK